MPDELVGYVSKPSNDPGLREYTMYSFSSRDVSEIYKLILRTTQGEVVKIENCRRIRDVSEIQQHMEILRIDRDRMKSNMQSAGTFCYDEI